VRQQGKYYRIGEASRVTGVEPHVLRYWEKEFREIRPHRVGRQRLYREADLEIIKKIKSLLYDEGMTIAGAKKKLRSTGKKAKSLSQEKITEVNHILNQIRHELKTILDILDRPK